MLDNLHIRLFVAHWVRIGPDWWLFKSLGRSYWRFYYNLADGAALEVPNSATESGFDLYQLEAHRPYFIPAYLRFNTRIDRDIDHFYIHFDVLGIPDLAMRTLFNSPVSLPHSEKFEQTILEVAHKVRSGRPVDLVLQCQLKALIYEGLGRYLDSLPEEQIQQPLRMAIALQPVLPAIHYIDANIAKPILNRDLAQLCQIHEDYFIRRFKDCVGQTPGDYIREQRVKQAAQLLLFTEDSLEEVAAASGFGSRFYLSRVFKELTGLSPVAYRKSITA